MKNFDIFLSYNWDVKPAVKELYKELTSNQRLTVWMDEYEMGQSRLADELSTGIKNSKVFVCCINKKYSESENCKDELDYAKNLRKPIIVLMMERIAIEDLGGVGFTIGPKVRFNCYKNPEMFQNWSQNEMFSSIMEAINAELHISAAISETPKDGKDTLISNETLEEEIPLVSTTKKYFALVQSDGNFVLYKSDSFKRDNPIWASNTWNSRSPRPFKLTLLPNGNLVLSDKNNTAVWTSNSSGKGQNGSHKLVLQNDGNLVLYDGTMQATWATNTWNK